MLLSSSAAPTEIYALSLPDALPICHVDTAGGGGHGPHRNRPAGIGVAPAGPARGIDRKSTRLNSSHMSISYAVFCLKKKKNHDMSHPHPTATLSGENLPPPHTNDYH